MVDVKYFINLSTEQAAELLGGTDIESGTYRNRFLALPAAVPYVPPPRPRPNAAPQSALVVGLPDARLTTDRDHRVRIQFHWQRGAQPNAGGLSETGPAGRTAGKTGNAPGNDQSGTWVRVAEWLSGPNWGSHFLPRIGTEVMVDFQEGDMDRPIIVGQVYNGADLPPFSAGHAAGANHPGVLSGWMSHNFEAGHNQWVADDAPGQLRTRLATSEQASQLALGHLIQQPVTEASRGAWRGSGFELRTDGWLAVRAGEGMLISSTARPDGHSTQMDVAEAVAQLKAAEQTARSLSDAAGAQRASPLKANAEQTRFIKHIDPAQDGQYTADVGGQPARKAQPGSREAGEPSERFAAPLILSEAPGDIGLTSPASTLLFAGEHLHATVQQDFHSASAYTFAAAVGEGASWFSHAGGIKSIAAAGSHTIQANTDALEILADQSVTVTSSNDEIHILAKEKIVLQAGQSSVTLEGSNITFACPGTFSVKGSAHAFMGPGQGTAEMEGLPDSRAKLFDEGFVLKDKDTGEPLANHPYRIKRDDGTYEEGTTDEHGMTHLVSSADAENVSIEILC